MTMLEFSGAIVLAIQFLFGAAVGIALGRQVHSFSWGRMADGLIGGIGGLLFVWPSPRIPGVGRFIGHLADGLTPTMVIGAAIAGLLGGLVLILLAGFIRVLMRGRQ
ncbi:hypothetical protein [Mesorhizobium sp. RMAD-H1]|uniref:hypothetical protein n=1 Tax=Mesorhizobium sp. RMAD-H1 TaxID=2587065 RepID=UPI00160C1F29|nr:hypothetical protein [Mesorhizobium sp. RMAD-H1]MBB2972736.1 LytS/YehU family sensor histidine kinase [Mesorhizobium sp. RMAD-H1]